MRQLQPLVSQSVPSGLHSTALLLPMWCPCLRTALTHMLGSVSTQSINAVSQPGRRESTSLSYNTSIRSSARCSSAIYGSPIHRAKPTEACPKKPAANKQPTAAEVHCTRAVNAKQDTESTTRKPAMCATGRKQCSFAPHHGTGRQRNQAAAACHLCLPPCSSCASRSCSSAVEWQATRSCAGRCTVGTGCGHIKMYQMCMHTYVYIPVVMRKYHQP